MRPLPSAILENAGALNPTGSYLLLMEIFVSSALTVRLARNSADVTFAGNVYEKFPFEVTPQREENTGNLASVSLTCGNATNAMSSLCERFGGLVDRTLTIYLVHTSDLSTTAQAYAQNFTIKTAVVNETAATFQLASEDFFSLTTPRDFYRRERCRWQYKGAEVYGIAITTASNASPVVITTPIPHGLVTGMRVRTDAIVGSTTANGDFIITRTGANTFTLDGTGAGGAGTGGTVRQLTCGYLPQTRTVTTTTNSGGEVLVTTSTPHGIPDNGFRVTLIGNSVAGYNADWTTDVISATTFKLLGSVYTINGAGGTVIINRPSCSRMLTDDNGCIAHQNNLRFGGQPAIGRPQ